MRKVFLGRLYRKENSVVRVRYSQPFIHQSVLQPFIHQSVTKEVCDKPQEMTRVADARADECAMLGVGAHLEASMTRVIDTIAARRRIFNVHAWYNSLNPVNSLTSGG